MSSDHMSGGGGASKTKKKKNHHNNKLSHNRSKPTSIPRPNRPVPLPLASPSNSFASEEEDYPMLKVSLSSISKLEVRNLKRKLTAELDDVRSLIARFFDPHKKTKTGHNKKGTAQIFKSCNALLSKLMKHKDGWVFNVPVDAKGLGLHDYHAIVKEPMDLGTVKGKLGSGSYESPLDFAEDVRLTFNNAILYNPVGHEVHSMAKFLLNMFEEKWVSIEAQFDNLNRKVKPTRDVAAAFSRPVVVAPPPVVEALPAPTPPPVPATVFEDRTLERAESMTTPVEQPETVTTATTLEKPEEEEEEAGVNNVRDLTMDEKRRLSEELQDLPYDKLETVVQIIKKSNPELSQQDDEIELDIDSVDVQTLWELYRFVIGYKESLSNKKEDQGFGSERDAESVHNSIQEPTTLATGTETSRANKSGKAIRMSSPGRQSSSSNSSSSDTGSGSSDSDSDSSSGHGSDTGN